jgi:GNAT superfamily N-acetyltransferase
MNAHPPGPSAVIRPARPDDVEHLHRLIVELAEYEREPDAVRARADDLGRALFDGSGTPSGQPALHGLVAEVDGVVAGMALWFLNYSTWRGRHGIYLEDLYVSEEFRGRGLGKSLLATLASICQERGYQRLEWWVLDWNAPAIEFYRSVQAEPMSEWTVFRLTDEALTSLARQAPGHNG